MNMYSLFHSYKKDKNLSFFSLSRIHTKHRVNDDLSLCVQNLLQVSTLPGLLAISYVIVEIQNFQIVT